MSAEALNRNIAVFITRDGMGSADEALRHTLASKWLQLIAQNESLPGAICFYAKGVHLVVSGSPVLEELSALERRGVHLIICKTCLDHYGLAGKVQVGVVGGMGDIIAAQWAADKTITL
jgi:hypothetical protein